MLSRYPITIFTLVQATFASRYLLPSQFCVGGCQEALSFVTFADSPSADYYDMMCKSHDRLESGFLCAQLYCTPEEIVSGFKEVDSQCQTYGKTGPIPPYEPHPNLSANDLRKMALADSKIILSGKPVNQSVIPAPESFDLAFRTIKEWNLEIARQIRYGWALYIFWLVILALAFGRKVIGSIASKLATRSRSDEGRESQSSATPPGTISKLWMKTNRYLLTPATVGSRSVQPYGWWTVPPLIESLVIFSFVTLNLILCCVSYAPFYGNLYWADITTQLWRYVADRTGVLSFANIPLVWLFGTRNNFLLWLTDWTPSTFNNYHRWIARVATLQAVIHSIAYTVDYYRALGKAYYLQEWNSIFFWTGGLATVVMCLLLGFSIYPLRKYFYDFFLLMHIILAVVTLVGCFYHVRIFEGDYREYLWAATAIWVFDRFLRIVRLAIGNLFGSTSGQRVKASYCKESDMVTLDVASSPVITNLPGTFYYIYVLNGLKFWESHPFTCSWGISAAPSADNSSGSERSAEVVEIADKSLGVSERVLTRSSNSDKLAIDKSRVRFFIRPAAGFTGRLRDLIVRDQETGKSGLKLLIEGPYGNPAPVNHYQNVLLIVGGSGITVALQSLQFLLKSSNSNRKPKSVHVVWAVRQTWLFENFGDEMKMYQDQLGMKITMHATGNRSITEENKKEFPNQEDYIISGWPVKHGRPNLHEVVRAERESVVGGLAVVGCCPPQMADDSRQACVNAMHSTNMNIEYFQESFSW